MTLDSRVYSIDAVTRQCYARGVPSETWLALVQQAATDGAATERDAIESLLTLLGSAPVPPPLLVSYLNAALLSSGPCAPARVARALSARFGPPPPGGGVSSGQGLSRATREVVLGAVLAALQRDGVEEQSARWRTPRGDRLKEEEGEEEGQEEEESAFDLLDALLPWLIAHPSVIAIAPHYLTGLLNALVERPLTEPDRVARMVDQLREAAEQLDHLLSTTAVGVAPLKELRDTLRRTATRLAPGVDRTVAPAPPSGGPPSGKPEVAGASSPTAPPAAATAKEDAAAQLRQSALAPSGDVLLLLSRCLSAPHRYSTDRLITSLSALIAYRLAQAGHACNKAARQSTLACVLAELVGGAVRLVQDATQDEVVLEAWLLVQLPQVLHSVTPGLPEGVELQSALGEALGAVRNELVAGNATATGADESDKNSERTLENLIVALCQRDLLSPDEGSSLAPQVDISELQPVTAFDYSGRFAGAGQEEIKRLLDEMLHSHANQRAIARALVEDLRTKSSSSDVLGLSIICDVLMECSEELAVLLLHVEPRELLAPVRAVLDSVDTSQDDYSDGNPIERYGSLVLFVQLVTSRFRLRSNLAYHLGSSSSFITRWLPSSSAVFALSTLSEDERSVVNGWIGALFGEGISDDLMHATIPRTLLRVAPTILKQSLMARQAGVVDLDSLRDALSYFLQELLRFTLPGVLLWLVEEIERTPASTPQQAAMLDILQTLALSPSLPAPVTELVAPALARLLLDPAIASLPSSVLDRTKLFKLIAPYRRPTGDALQWAPSSSSSDLPFEPVRTPQEQLRADLNALGSDSTLAPVPLVNLARCFDRARASSARYQLGQAGAAAFLREVLLHAALATITPSSMTTPSSSLHAERAVVALLVLDDDASSFSSATTTLSTPPPLVEALISDVLLPDLSTWARTSVHPSSSPRGVENGPVPPPPQDYPPPLLRAQVEGLADFVAGAAIGSLAFEHGLEFAEAEAGAGAGTRRKEERTKRLLGSLEEGVRAARRGGGRVAHTGGGGSDAASTVLDAFVARLASWPAMVEACPVLASPVAEGS